MDEHIQHSSLLKKNFSCRKQTPVEWEQIEMQRVEASKRFDGALSSDGGQCFTKRSDFFCAQNRLILPMEPEKTIHLFRVRKNIFGWCGALLNFECPNIGLIWIHLFIFTLSAQDLNPKIWNFVWLKYFVGSFTHSDFKSVSCKQQECGWPSELRATSELRAVTLWMVFYIKSPPMSEEPWEPSMPTTKHHRLDKNTIHIALNKFGRKVNGRATASVGWREGREH